MYSPLYRALKVFLRKNSDKILLKIRNMKIKNIFIVLMLTGILSSLQAQETKVMKHTWWFGAAVGVNINSYRGSTRELNSGLISPVAFHNGNGDGLYFAPLAEYHFPGSGWGIMLQAGYDSRKGSFEPEISPHICFVALFTNLSYITVEPSLRFALFKSKFYLYGGPRLAFNLNKSFSYIQLNNSDFYNDKVPTEVKGDFSNMKKAIISMQIGAGYDIPIVSRKNPTQIVLSPFVSFQPYFGQSPRSIETWNISTLRAGVAFKLSQHKSNISNKRRYMKRKLF